MKKKIDIRTIGQVDEPKRTLRDTITKNLTINGAKMDLNFPVPNEMPKIRVNPPIEMLIPNELEYSIIESIERAKKHIRPELIFKWEEFSKEYAYFYSGLFIKRLTTILMLLESNVALKEIEEYLINLPLHKELINYLCIAIIRFSDKGTEFYEKFYSLDIDGDKVINLKETETKMCRILTKN